jgi:GTP-binding protein Era
MKSGIVALIGRPNVGKSTLINALVKEKIAIVSDKPQTTRHIIHGIIQGSDYQIVLVDTPGIHKPRTTLGTRLNSATNAALDDIDVVCVLLPANDNIGVGDKMILDQISKLSCRKIAVVSKSDSVKKPQLLQKLQDTMSTAQEFSFEWDEIIPVSARKSENILELEQIFVSYLPESQVLYPEDAITNQDQQHRIAELIREAVIRQVFDEVPHSILIDIDEIIHEESGLVKIFASIYVERESQKGIIVGKGGSQLKEIGTRARKEIQQLLKAKVYLDLRVKVESNWQSNTQTLDKFGF